VLHHFNGLALVIGARVDERFVVLRSVGEEANALDSCSALLLLSGFDCLMLLLLVIEIVLLEL